MRILTVNYIRSLLMDGIEDLLETNGNGKFEVVRTLANNLADLIREIEQLKPNVIIIEEASTFIRPADLITSPLNLRRMRLIVLNTRTSNIDIYDKSEFTISNPGHLIEALNYGTAPNSLQGGVM